VTGQKTIDRSDATARMDRCSQSRTIDKARIPVAAAAPAAVAAAEVYLPR
jgi:hypothetical protein